MTAIDPTGRAGRTRCVIYARVSSRDQQREGYSIPAQKRLLRAYAEEHGMVVSRVFVDVETAGKAGRQAFGEMLAYLQANPACRTIVAEKTDRLYRNIKDWVVLDELELEVHLVKEGQVISRDSRSHEKLMHGIKVLLAKNFLDNLSEEVKKGMVEKARQGHYPSMAPLGYLNVRKPGGKSVLEPDPVRATIIGRLFELYAGGEHSIQSLTDWARSAGLSHRKTGSPPASGTIHRILRNKIYRGDFEWDGQLYKGKHKPLVTPLLWLKVQAVLDDRNNAKPHSSRLEFAFSGLLKCGHCGCSIVAERKKGKYVYYHCTHYRQKCPDPYVREEVLAERFTEVLEHLEFSDEVMAWLIAAFEERNDRERKYCEKAVEELRQQYDGLQARLDTMYEDRLDGRISTALFERKAEEYQARMAEIYADIAAHEHSIETDYEEAINVLELVRTASERFGEMPPAKKRALLQSLLSNCTWKAGELTAMYREPFGAIADANREYSERKAAGAETDSLRPIWYPRRDSNPCTRLRRPVLYPAELRGHRRSEVSD